MNVITNPNPNPNPNPNCLMRKCFILYEFIYCENRDNYDTTGLWTPRADLGY